MVRIGFNLWYGNRPLYYVMKDCYEVGFDYVELSIDYPWPYRMDVDEVKRAVRDFGIEVGIHGPWRDIALASPVPEIREASLKVMRKVIELAGRLRALYVNVHVSCSEAVEFKEVWNEVLRAGIESVRELQSLCEQYGVDLVVENNDHRPFSDIQQLVDLIVRVKGVYFCLDVGHAVGAYLGKVPIENHVAVIENFAQALGDRLLVAHLHDFTIVNGRYRDHLLVGSGVLDLASVCRILRRVHRLQYTTLEVFKLSPRGGDVKPRDAADVLRKLRKHLT